jgi:6-phosphofructokinase 2
MSTIVTVTFSPCIDKSTSIPALFPEKKLRCANPKLEPGGGGINVARAIKKLGGIATAIYPAGGYTGEYFNHLLREEGIPAIVINTTSETRENIIVYDESTGNQYRFGMPGTLLSEPEWKACLQAVEKIPEIGFIIASGSLPPGVPHNVYAQLARLAKIKNARYIVDTSGDALKEAFDEGVYLLKPNLAELCSLAGKDYLEPAEIKTIARTMIAKGNCEVLVISMGAAGALLVTADIAITVTPPVVERKSTVGAGDSMVAGIVFYLARGYTIEDAVRYGVACGTAATLHAGTELCNKEAAEKIFQQVITKRE